MSLRYYANAPATTLSASCTSVATSIVVASVTGLPIQFPYTLILDRATATEEAVSVTAAGGTTLTVVRAIDSTTAFAHSIGAVVEHGITAQDIRESNAHVNATAAVHGVAGTIVGTTDAQTLTNKTLGSTNTLNGFTASQLLSSDGTGKAVASGRAVPAGAIVGTTDAQTLTTKTVALGSNTVTGTTAQFNTALTDNDFATLAGVETLTNKDLTSGTNSFPSSLATLTGVQVLTNKDLTSATNTFPTAAAANVQVFSSGGTWTKLAGAKRIRVRLVGGGGGGGGATATSASIAGQHIAAGAGGSAGGYAEAWIDPASLGATVTVTVGAGGAGGAGIGAGSSGGTSSFGTSVIASGGTGANGGPNCGGNIFVIAVPNSPGTGTTGAILLGGGSGGESRYTDGLLMVAGHGGDSALGRGGATPNVNGDGQPGGVGAGGSGASNWSQLVAADVAAHTGGAGGAGMVIIETFFA